VVGDGGPVGRWVELPVRHTATGEETTDRLRVYRVGDRLPDLGLGEVALVGSQVDAEDVTEGHLGHLRLAALDQLLRLQQVVGRADRGQIGLSGLDTPQPGTTVRYPLDLDLRQPADLRIPVAGRPLDRHALGRDVGGDDVR